MLETTQPHPKILIDVIVILLIGLIAVVGYKLSPLLSPPVDQRIATPADCNLHRAPCTVMLEGGSLEVSLSPRPVPLIKPIVVEVHAKGISITRMDADFAGIGMNMGLNRPQLMAAGTGLYQAETSLPVCITGTMQWEFTLMVETGGKHYLVPFRFTTPESGGGG